MPCDILVCFIDLHTKQKIEGQLLFGIPGVKDLSTAGSISGDARSNTKTSNSYIPFKKGSRLLQMDGIYKTASSI